MLVSMYPLVILTSARVYSTPLQTKKQATVKQCPRRSTSVSTRYRLIIRGYNLTAGGQGKVRGRTDLARVK